MISSFTLSIGSILCHILLHTEESITQRIAIERALDDILHLLHISRQLELIIRLRNTNLRITVCYDRRGNIYRLRNDRQIIATLEVMPGVGFSTPDCLPREQIENQACLPYMKIEISQNFSQHILLSPDIILLITQKEKLRNTNIL